MVGETMGTGVDDMEAIMGELARHVVVVVATRKSKRPTTIILERHGI